MTEDATLARAAALTHPDVRDVEAWVDGAGQFGLNITFNSARSEAQVVAEIVELVTASGVRLPAEAVRVVQLAELADPKPDDPARIARQRAGRTKRSRTRASLLGAAGRIFELKGWQETRMEDVAAAAGVSVATVYNYFPSKYAIIGHVFGPLVAERQMRARAQLEGGIAPLALAQQHIADLAVLGRSHRPLAVAFVGAVHEYTARAGGPPSHDDDEDPRVIAPFPDLLVAILAAGQGAGEVRRWPPAVEMATTTTNILLLRLLTRPDESAEETTEFVLTALLGVAAPDMLVEGRGHRPLRSQARRLVSAAYNRA